MDKKERNEIIVTALVGAIGIGAAWYFSRGKTIAQQNSSYVPAPGYVPTGSIAAVPPAQSNTLNPAPLTFTIGGNTISFPSPTTPQPYGGGTGGGCCNGGQSNFVIGPPYFPPYNIENLPMYNNPLLGSPVNNAMQNLTAYANASGGAVVA